jgi:serine protease AprX
MCATIAGATKSAGGKFDGVAPDATILSARTTLMASDIHIIYDELISAKKGGKIPGPLVISNSYGLYTCSAPTGLPEDHPYLDIVVEAVKNSIPVVFAAGNNHWDVLCKYDPKACTPNTIWGVNSHDMVMSVGTVNENNSNQDSATPHPNSSRGPGQWAHSTTKPDCVAPTYGEVVWGCGYRHMDWWGTSGACPQVAGLAALLLSANPALSPAQVYNIIRRTCKVLGAPPTCVGAGLIDCAAAVAGSKRP